MNIHGLEVGAAPLFANLNAKNCREAARNLVKAVGLQVADRVIDLFAEEYKKEMVGIGSATPPLAKTTEVKDAVREEVPKKEKKTRKSKKK